MATAKNETKPTEETTTEEVQEEVIKQGFKKIRIKDFRGFYADTFFNDDCEAEISDATLEVLTKQFPNAKVEEIK